MSRRWITSDGFPSIFYILAIFIHPTPLKRIRTILFKRFVACRCIEVFLIYFFRVRYMIRERMRERSWWKLSNTRWTYRSAKAKRWSVSAFRLFRCENNNREIGSWPRSHLHSVKFSPQPAPKRGDKAMFGLLIKI